MKNALKTVLIVTSLSLVLPLSAYASHKNGMGMMNGEQGMTMQQCPKGEKECPMADKMKAMQSDMGAMMSGMQGMMDRAKDPAMKEQMQKMHEQMGGMMKNMRQMHEQMMQDGTVNGKAGTDKQSR